MDDGCGAFLLLLLRLSEFFRSLGSKRRGILQAIGPVTSSSDDESKTISATTLKFPAS